MEGNLINRFAEGVSEREIVANIKEEILPDIVSIQAYYFQIGDTHTHTHTHRQKGSVSLEIE